MNKEIKEILDKIPLNVLEALGNLESGALNYYKAPKTIEVYRNTILDYITNLEQENERLGKLFYERNEENIKLKSRIDKANWWLKEMLKQAKSEETKAIINGTLELLLNGGDEE